MPRTRVHNLMISVDGFAAGEYVTADEPIGGAQALFSYFDGRVIDGIGHLDQAVTADHAFFSMWGQGIGAEIMGRKKFGPQTGPWIDDGWKGWWGDAPPFRTPTFVLTHHPRDPIVFDNGTSFHFVSGTPAEVLTAATASARGLDVRLGGGPSSVRQFLADDLVDFLHLCIIPLALGSGVRLWDGLGGLEERFDVESVTTASGLTHQLWNRLPRS